MGYTYNESLNMAKSVLTQARNTNNMNKDVQRQLNEIILENGNSEAEVVQARGDEKLLVNRLDKIDDEVDRNYTKSTSKKRPLVSFYLDDGYQNDYDVVLPKASSLGIPLTICLFNNSQLVSTPERLDELVNTYGWELHAHTATHADMDKLTLDQQRKEMKDNKDFFKEMGYDLEGICYPKGLTNADTLKASREYFKVGMSSVQNINDSPVENYYIRRYLTDSTDLNNLKSNIDKIKSEGEGWIVIYSHSNVFKTNTAVRDRFFEMMEYVANAGVETVTVKEAMEVYGNTLEVGDKQYDDNVFSIGSDGTVDTTSIPIIQKNYGQSINTKSGLDFPVEKITINRFPQNNPSDIPINNGIGTLMTDRLIDNSTPRQNIAMQIFTASDGRISTRSWGRGEWSDWTTSGYNISKISNVTSDTPMNEFPIRKVSRMTFVSSENTGFPEGGIGTLEVSRLSNNDILNFQLWFPYNKNIFYKRYWTTSGWSSWGKLTESLAHSESVSFGTIEANATKTYTVTVPGVTVNDSINVNFRYGIANNIVPVCYASATNAVTIKLLNISSTPTEVGQRTVIVSVLKA